MRCYVNNTNYEITEIGNYLILENYCNKIQIGIVIFCAAFIARLIGAGVILARL